jgi:hypothetical protein
MAGQNSVRMAVTEPCRLSACREVTEERQGEVSMKRRLLVSSPLNAIVVTLTILALLLYYVRLISATGTTLGDPAASMQPGTWATLTNPVNKVLVFCSAGTNGLYKLSRSGQAPSTAPLLISPIGRKTWNRVAVKSGGLIQDQSKQVMSLIFSCQHSSPLLQEVEIAVRKKYSNWRYV